MVLYHAFDAMHAAAGHHLSHYMYDWPIVTIDGNMAALVIEALRTVVT